MKLNEPQIEITEHDKRFFHSDYTQSCRFTLFSEKHSSQILFNLQQMRWIEQFKARKGQKSEASDGKRSSKPASDKLEVHDLFVDRITFVVVRMKCQKPFKQFHIR